MHGAANRLWAFAPPVAADCYFVRGYTCKPTPYSRIKTVWASSAEACCDACWGTLG